MKLVEAGTFQMGSDAADDNDWDKPVHSVTLTKDYYMGETEVTQALWYAVMGSVFLGYRSSNLPVDWVSWDDCQTFITKLNALTGATFRLPTEAEWEFAAKGGKKSQGYTYAGSNTIEDVAWYSENSYSLGSSSPDYGTHAVATKAPNELGLYDMSGNVTEECQDRLGEYSSDVQADPTGPDSGTYHVYRGGSWFGKMDECRVTARGRSTGYRSWSSGLRLALVPLQE